MEGWHHHEMTGNSRKEMTLDEEEKESWRPDLRCVRKTLGKNNEDLDSPPMEPTVDKEEMKLKEQLTSEPMSHLDRNRDHFRPHLGIDV
ncbi:Protein Capicua [Manis pentadactyla]|nr:Protein Capicua [Manis pentadactyla]